MRIPLVRSVMILSLFAIGTKAFALEEPKILPKGIKRFRMVGVTAKEVSTKFNKNGQVASLGGANRTVTINDLATKNPDLKRLVNGLNALQAGLGDNLYTGNLYQNISVQQNIYGMAFEWGIAEKWNIGIRARVVERNAKTSFSVVQNQNNSGIVLNKLQKNASLTPGLAKGLAAVNDFNTSFFERALFTDRGYQAPRNFKKTQLGYTELGAKYQIVANESSVSSVLLGVRLPTGQDPVLDNPLDKGTGGNFWALGTEVAYRYNVTEFIGLQGAVKGKYFFTKKKDIAVPLDASDALPSLLPEDNQVRSVSHTQGVETESELATILNIPGNAFKLWGAFQYKTGGTDKFEGEGDLFYGGLSNDSNYNASATEFGAGYSTIQSFREGKFFLPMQIEALYNNTFAGKNIPKSAYVRVDLKVYF